MDSIVMDLIETFKAKEVETSQITQIETIILLTIGTGDRIQTVLDTIMITIATEDGTPLTNREQINFATFVRVIPIMRTLVGKRIDPVAQRMVNRHQIPIHEILRSPLTQ